jgi:hypothetical protein
MRGKINKSSLSGGLVWCLIHLCWAFVAGALAAEPTPKNSDEDYLVFCAGLVKSEILWFQSRLNENVLKENEYVIIKKIDSRLSRLESVVSGYSHDRLTVLSALNHAQRSDLRSKLELKIFQMKRKLLGFGLKSKDPELLESRLKELLEELEEFKRMIQEVRNDP